MDHVYISTDLIGRVNIPSAMINPNLKNKRCNLEYKDGKIILKYSKDQPDIPKGRRVTIPVAIRNKLKLRRNDYFKVIPNKDCSVFTLALATDELTAEDLESDNNNE